MPQPQISFMSIILSSGYVLFMAMDICTLYIYVYRDANVTLTIYYNIDNIPFQSVINFKNQGYLLSYLNILSFVYRHTFSHSLYKNTWIWHRMGVGLTKTMCFTWISKEAMYYNHNLHHSKYKFYTHLNFTLIPHPQ